MAMQHGGDIHYGIKFNVDKSNLNAMKTSLQEIRTLAQNSLNNIGTQGTQQVNTQLQNILTTTQKIDVALDSAFDMSLGNVNLAKFNQNLQASGVNLKTYQQQLASIGPAGQASFRNLATEIMTTTMKIQQSNTMLDKMKTTFANTIRWSISSSILMGFTSSVQKAYSYVKELDTSLNNIMLVTEKSSDQMAEFARQANKAAKELGQTTTAYTNASLIYYQQGLADAEVSARTETTLKAANVTKQSADAVSEQLTAVWNGYKVTAAETELYIDKLAKVAATTASDLEELSTGMSKVASAANIMGVDIDQLNGMLSTVISVTREAPESIGTSFKTIFARMSDIEAGLDTETTLGEYTQGMAELGFNVLDAQGKIRDMGEVIEEIGGKWNTLTREQQLSLAQTMAGTRQYSRLLSLFDNWDMYTKAVSESANATGFLQQQQDEYMESMEAHLTQLKAASQGLYDSLFESDSLNNIIDVLTSMITLADNFVQSIGGGGNVLMMGLLLLLKTFSDKLATTFVNMQSNSAKMAANTANEIAQREILSQLEVKSDEALTKMVELKSKALQHSKLMNAEEAEQVDSIIRQINQEANYITQLEEEENLVKKIAKERMQLNNFVPGANISGENKAQLTHKEQNAKAMARGVLDSDRDAFFAEMDEAWDLENTSRKELASAKRVLGRKNLSEAKRVEWTERQKIANENMKKVANMRESAGQEFKEKTLASAENYYGADSAEYAKMEKAIDGVIQKNTQFKSSSSEVKTTFHEMQGTVKGFGETAKSEVKKFTESSKKDFDSMKESAKRALTDTENAATQMGNAFGKRANTQNIMNMISAIGTLTMSISMLKNAFTVWGNESLSSGEKVLQFMQTLGFALPMLYSSYKQLISSSTILMAIQGAMGKIIKGQTIEQLALAAAEEFGFKTKAKSVATEGAAYLIKKRYLQLLKEEALAHGGNMSAIDAETKAKLKNQATDEVNTLRRKGNKQVRGEGVQTFKDGAKNAWNWVKANGKLIGGIALIAAGILVFAGALKMADKAWNKTKYEAEAAAEASKLANEEFSKAKESYDAFKDSVSKYSEATSALNDLEKGTVEYREKVLEANEAALKLIQTIDGLSYSINAETKLIELNEEAWEDAQEAQLKKMESAQAYAAFANQRSQDAQLAYEQTKFNREQVHGDDKFGFGDDMTDRDKKNAWTQGGAVGLGALAGTGVVMMSTTAATALSATAAGAALGSAVPLLGTAIGAAVGLIVGGVMTAVNIATEKEETKEEQDGLQVLAEAYKQEGNSALAKIDTHLTGFSEDLRESLKAMDPAELEKQLQAINANTEALERNSAMIAGAANVNNGNEYYNKLDEKEQGLADKIIADRRSKATTEQVEKEREKAEDLFKGGFLGIGSDQDAYDEYLKYRYGDDAKNYRVEDQFGTNATLQRKNEDGTWETIGEKNSLSNDEVIDFLQEQYLLQMTGADQESLDKIMEAGNKIDAIKGVDDDEVLAIQESLAMGDNADLSVLSPEQVAELEKQMDEIGALLGEDYAKALQNGIDNYDEALYMKHINEQYQQALSDVAQELEVDKDTLEMYTDAIIGNNEALAENSEIAVEAARQQISFAQGTEDLQSALEDNLDILRTWNEDAFETYEAAAEVQDALEKMFNVKVSADFIKNNLEDIEKAAEGDVEAIEKLSLLAAQDYTASLNIDKDRLSDVNSLLEELANKDIGIGVSTDIDTSAGIQALNELLASGAITQEQMEKMFSSIGYKPEVKMVTVKGKPTTTTQTHKIDGPGFINYEYTDTITSQTDVAVPQIADEDIDVGDIKVGEGTAGSFTQTTTSQTRAKAQGSLGDKDIKSGTEKNKKDLLDEERDIYHDINIELQKLENNLEKVQKAREKLVGGDIIDSLDKELGLLDKQIAAQKTKLEIAKLESQTLKEILSGQGVQFAEDGTITNYNAILDAKEAEINGLINAYNNANSTDAQESIQEQIDAKQEAYDQFKENLERYDEVTFSELAELENEISEAISKKIELNIEKFTKDITLKVDLNEFKKEWRELQKEVLFGEDNLSSNFNSSIDGLKDVVGSNGDGLFKDQIDRMHLFMDEYNKIISGGRSEIFEDSAAAALEQAQEMANLAQSSAEEIQEYIKTIEETVENAIEQITSLHDSILDTFEYQLAVIEHEISVKELLGGELTDTTLELAEKLDVQIQKINSNRKQIEDLQYILDSRGDNYKQDNFVEWAEDVSEISSAYENMFGSIEEALQSINDLLQETLQNSLKTFENNITQNIGWNVLSERWERDQDLAEIYLSSVNQEYELQKLINKINEDLLKKEYDRLDIQKKINNFKNNELEILMKKDKLTQAEVDRANKLYELTLAQIALEDARNNKSTMKLTRDSQGNYVYQYGADEDKISEAQQNLLDKQNDLYNSNVENVIESISNFNSAGQEMQDELANLFEDDKFQKYLGLSSSKEGRMSQEFKELDNWLKTRVQEISDDSQYRMSAYQQGALQSLEYIFKDLNMKNVDLNNLTQEQREILETEGIDLNDLKVLKEFNKDIISEQIQGFNSTLNQLVDRYGKDVQSVFQAAGMEGEFQYYDNLGLIKINTDLLRDDIEEEKEKTKQIYDELNRFMNDDMVRLKQWFEKFFTDESGQFATGITDIAKAMEDNAEAVSKKIDEEIEEIKLIKDTVNEIPSEIQNIANSIDGLKEYIGNLYQSSNPETKTDSRGTSLNESSLSIPQNIDANADKPWEKFKKGQRVKLKSNGINTYRIESIDEYGAITINDIKDSKDKSRKVGATMLEAVNNNAFWKMLTSDTYNKNLYYYNEHGTRFHLIAYEKNLKKGIAEITQVGKNQKDKYKVGDRIWFSPLDKNSNSSKWKNLFTGVELSKETGKITGQYNTGGYTGAWFNGSKEGRLAVLHQKELVLNETDTPKILDAVKAAREFSTGSIIKDFQNQMKVTLTSLENQLIGTYASIDSMAAAAQQSTNQLLEQAVQIDASFPGVRDSREIEEALKNLVNVASQYAYIKK